MMKIFLAGSRVQGHALMAILLPPPHPACSHEQSAGISCAICMPLFEVLKNFNFSLQVTVEKIYRYFSLQERSTSLYRREVLLSTGEKYFSLQERSTSLYRREIDLQVLLSTGTSQQRSRFQLAILYYYAIDYSKHM
jgi:hypothetical protein